MTENKENSVNSEKDTSKEIEPAKKADKKKKSPLWKRFFAFTFSIIVSGFLIYSFSLEEDIRGKTCAEKEKHHQEFLLLQDRVAQLEQTIKISGYLQGGGNSQVKKDLDIIFEKIDMMEEKIYSSTNSTLNEVEDTMLNDEALGKVAKLERELASLKSSVDNLFTEKEILKEQANQINSSIKSINEIQNKGLKTFFAFEKLKSTIASQSPYSNELDTLKSLLSNVAETKWEILEQNKDTGISNIESLTQQLRKYIKIAITTPDADSDWWDKTKTNMSKVVTVRKQGFVEGNDAEEILARAEYNLATNQTVAGLSAAMDEINTLPAETVAIFADWTNDANAIINTQKVLGEIRQDILLDGVK